MLASVDPDLGAWMQILPAPRPKKRGGHFAALCRAIVAQQLSDRVAAVIWKRLVERVGAPRGPTASALSSLTDAEIRSVGVSGPKVRYLRALAEAFEHGHLRGYRFARMSNASIIEDLTMVSGVGRWTAEMFLIFSMHRADVFAGGDLALRNAIARLDGVARPTPSEACLRAQRWQPWRSLASLYLWQIAHWKGPLPG